MSTDRKGNRVVRSWSFRRQIVVLTATVTAFAMVLLTVVLQLVLSTIANRDVDRVLAERAEAVMSAITTGPSAAGFNVADATLDEGVAVYDAQGRLAAGTPAPRFREQYQRRARTNRTTTDAIGDLSRIRAEPFTVSDARGVVVVNEYLQPYEEAERLALIVSLVTGTAAVTGAAVVAACATRRALVPVERMALTAAEWSEHDLSRRFALGSPTNEITALGQTLDALLDKVSAAIRSEQRLTSELAHELRTPLTTIQGTADLMLLREGDSLTTVARDDVHEIAAASRRMSHTIAALLEVARAEAIVVAAGHSELGEVMADVLGDLDGDSVLFAVDVEDVRLGVPHQLAVRALGPVVHNAVQHARTAVEVTAHAGPGQVEVRIRDDGPGVALAVRDVIFEPGTTTASDGARAGLGLALARRVARAVGGEVSLSTGADGTVEDGTAAAEGGATFVVHLPLA